MNRRFRGQSEGIESFPGQPAPRLREFLITEYESRGWTEKAAEFQKK